jgi:hypothetical protein
MGYRELRKFIQPLTRRASKDETATKFQITLARIQQYVVRNDDNDWKRSVNCGITWVGDAIAISTRQLSKLIGKCKSSINSGFRTLGYATVLTNLEHAALLTRVFPFMMDNSTELRQWTVRKTTGTPPTIEPVEDMAIGQLVIPLASSIPVQDDLSQRSLNPTLSRSSYGTTTILINNVRDPLEINPTHTYSCSGLPRKPYPKFCQRKNEVISVC